MGTYAERRRECGNVHYEDPENWMCKHKSFAPVQVNVSVSYST